ncbi:MAG: Uma2 family endonuclease [Pirellulales bacterium]
MATTETLLTADEFAQLEGLDGPAELVRGIVQMMNLPNPRHGQVCANATGMLWAYFRQNELGRVVSNDAAIVTTRSPDSVRGADVAVYLYTTVPPGPLPQRYHSAVPDVVFEVRSPSDRASELLAKVAEYLAAGVKAVCLLEPDDERLTIYTERGPARQFGAQDRFELPDLLGNFSAPVREFFA